MRTYLDPTLAGSLPEGDRYYTNNSHTNKYTVTNGSESHQEKGRGAMTAEELRSEGGGDSLPRRVTFKLTPKERPGPAR